MTSDKKLKELNKTELVHLAAQITPNVHRGMRREVLVRIILEGDDTSFPLRPVDHARDDIYQMAVQHWNQIKTLVTCPLKTQNPRSCYSCTDVQVAECTIMNHKLIKRTRSTKSKSASEGEERT